MQEGCACVDAVPAHVAALTVFVPTFVCERSQDENDHEMPFKHTAPAVHETTRLVYGSVANGDAQTEVGTPALVGRVIEVEAAESTLLAELHEHTCFFVCVL